MNPLFPPWPNNHQKINSLGESLLSPFCVYLCVYQNRVAASRRQNQDAYFISSGILMPHVNVVSPHTDLMHVCSVFLPSDMTVNHAFCKNKSVYMRVYVALQITEKKLNPGLKWWSHRSALLHWSVGKCMLWNSLQFKKKKSSSKICLCNRRDFTSGPPRGKDLPVSKRANESFLAEGDIYAYRVSGTAASLSSSYFCHMALSSSWVIEALGVWLWPLQVRGHLFHTWTS